MNIDYMLPIENILAASSDVMSIIGTVDTIFWNDAPADTKKYIVVYEVDETYINYSKSHFKRIQVMAYHTNKFKCAKLAEYINTALHTLQGAASGVVFSSIYNVNSLGITQTDNGEYIAINDYRIVY